MENDLTLLYTSSSVMDENVSKKIREELTKFGYPIVSVTQKPIDFGKNICVGDIGVNKYSEYKQILTGLKEIKTKYVACVDDDTLYSPEHFLNRPEDNTFIYEMNYWFAQEELDYFWRVPQIEKRGGMWGCIANTQTILNNLSKRFELYPVNPFVSETGEILKPKYLWWGEPGWHDNNFKTTGRLMRIYTEQPCVVFVHAKSMGYNQLRKFYRRYGYPLPADRVEKLDQFGTMQELRDRFWN